MPKGRRGGGGAPFRTEAEAEVYAMNELKKAGVDRYKGIPDRGVTSKAANHAVLHVSWIEKSLNNVAGNFKSCKPCSTACGLRAVNWRRNTKNEHSKKNRT